MSSMQRTDIIDLMWEKAEPVVFFSKETFVCAYFDWDLYPVIDNGTVLALVAQKGPEFHFQSMGRPIPRRVVVSFLQGFIDRYGHAVTKTPKWEERQHRFNRAVGFEVTGEDEYDVHYRIDRVRGRAVS